MTWWRNNILLVLLTKSVETCVTHKSKRLVDVNTFFIRWEVVLRYVRIEYNSVVSYLNFIWVMTSHQIWGSWRCMIETLKPIQEIGEVWESNEQTFSPCFYRWCPSAILLFTPLFKFPDRVTDGVSFELFTLNKDHGSFPSLPPLPFEDWPQRRPLISDDPTNTHLKKKSDT